MKHAELINSILTGVIVGTLAVLAVRPRLLYTPSGLSAVAMLAGVAGFAFGFLIRRWRSRAQRPDTVPDPSLPITGAAVVLAGTILSIRSASQPELLNATVLAACLAYYLSMRDKTFVALVAALAIVVTGVLCVLLDKNFLAIGLVAGGILAACVQLRHMVGQGTG